MRLKVIAAERAPTIAAVIHASCHAEGSPRAAKTAPSRFRRRRHLLNQSAARARAVARAFRQSKRDASAGGREKRGVARGAAWQIATRRAPAGKVRRGEATRPP
jgi:hypothetical protein